jgi:hypothetical protein
MEMDTLLKQVKAVLSTSSARWQCITRDIPIELLTRAPAPKEWSALECLQHLIDTERWVFPIRLLAFLKGQNIPAFDPDTQGSKSVSGPVPMELALEFTNLRSLSLDLLNDLTPADLSRTARHSELGQVMLADMMCEWAGHDLMHIVQAERAVMQPFIIGSGPWRVYFSDHEVKSHNP